MPSEAKLATVEKQLVKAEKDIASLEARKARAQEQIDAHDGLVLEVRDRISYLTRVRDRLRAAAPVAAADGETPVLNTDAPDTGVTHPEAEVTDASDVVEHDTVTAISDDPRVTGTYA